MINAFLDPITSRVSVIKERDLNATEIKNCLFGRNDLTSDNNVEFMWINSISTSSKYLGAWTSNGLQDIP
jgi:hypothetical protein